MYCFSFCLLWKIFVSPSILNDSFSGYSILGLKLFSLSAQNTLLHAFFAFKASVEKSAVILVGLHLYVIYFFLSYSLQYSFSVLWASCFNDNMPWRGSTWVKSIWFPRSFLYLNE
jgi:hypothetical protein